MSRPEIAIRAALESDARRLWTWRNEPSGLRYYFSPKPVSWRDHIAWLTARLADKNVHIFILESGRRPVGQVRVELSRGIGHVHVVLDAKVRGKGFGSAGIDAASRRLLRSRKARKLIAQIKPDNLASVMAFLKAGFRFKRWVTVKGTACYEFERSAS